MSARGPRFKDGAPGGGDDEPPEDTDDGTAPADRDPRDVPGGERREPAAEEPDTAMAPPADPAQPDGEPEEERVDQTTAEAIQRGREALRGGLAAERATVRERAVGAQREAAAERRAVAEGRLSGAVSAAAAIPERIEAQIERETGREVDLTFEDIRVTEEGRTELTEAGRTKIETAALTEAVADIEERLGFDVPGEGPIATAEGREADLGDVPVTIPVFGDRPTARGPRAAPREQVGETTFEERLQRGREAIIEATAVGEAGTFAEQFGPEAAAAVERQREEGFTEAELTRQTFAGGATEGLARTPALAISGIQLGKDVVDVSAEAASRVTDEGIEGVIDLGEDVGLAAGTGAALAASGAIEEPVRTGGAITGGLVGSALLLGGAAAVGARTGQTARFLVQPGEEIVGIGGFRATRAIAGERAAQRLFPHQEPLIFSEEAAIRTVRGASRRVRTGTARTRDVLTGREAVGPSPRQTEVIERFRPGEPTGVAIEGEAVGGEAVAPGRDPDLPPPRADPLTRAVAAEAEDPLAPVDTGAEAPATEREPAGVTPELEDIALEAELAAERERLREAIQRSLERGEVPRGLTIEVDPEATAAGGPFAAGFNPASQRAIAIEQEAVTRSRIRDFDPTRPELEGEPGQALTRRQIAQRRQLGGTFEGEFDPIGRARARARARPVTEPELATEVEPELGTDVEVSVLGETETLLGELEDLDLGVETVQEPAEEVVTVQAPEVVQEPDIEFEAEPEPETEPEPEPEPEFEPEPEPELEPEPEFEFEPETEPERERRRPEEDDDEDPLDFRLFEEEFEFGVASPEFVLTADVLGDLTDPVLEPDEL